MPSKSWVRLVKFAFSFKYSQACFIIGPNPSHTLDGVSQASLLFSAAIIFTTIHTQDFPDIEGDSASGRITFPIYAPEISRILTLIILPLWSTALSQYWKIGPFATSTFILFGLYVAVRFYLWRETRSDKDSYFWFNVGIASIIIYIF